MSSAPAREANVAEPGDQTAGRAELLDDLGASLIELLGAERRLRGREQHREQHITHAQLRALRALAQQPEVSAGELARRADVNPASTTGMLDALEGCGIVQRRRSSVDRRVCMVSLTERGRALLRVKDADWRGVWEQALDEISDEELAAATAVMNRIAGMLDSL